MEKIQYKCKKCGWGASIPGAWGDLKPHFCGGRKCNTSFRKDPDSLLVISPVVQSVQPAVLDTKIKYEFKKATKKEEITE